VSILSVQIAKAFKRTGKAVVRCGKAACIKKPCLVECSLAAPNRKRLSGLNLRQGLYRVRLKLSCKTQLKPHPTGKLQTLSAVS
jgi:hypothetical protein